MSWDFLFDRVVPWLLVAQLALIIWNRRVLIRPRPRTWTGDAPLISVLIPARNEEETIGACLSGVLAQDYQNLEVIVLDDGSLDATAEIVRSADDSRVRLVPGEPLPDGWTGKNWACHQLATRASGDVLCFVDADTVLAPEAVSAAAGALQEEEAGLVSLLPRAEPGSRAGQVLLPMVSHATFALFPIAAIHSTGNPVLAAAFGPFILVTREAYRDAGGHAANPGHIVDDVQLSRGVKATGRPVRLFNGSDLVQTRWYRELGEIWTGFSKNAYSALDHNPWVAAFIILVLAPLLLSPFVRVALGVWEGAIPTLAMWQMLLLLANRALTSVSGRDPLWSVPLHAFTIAFWAATLAWSVMLFATGRSVVWKDRAVATGTSERSD
jgi:chlorobactene glucosyltransferase